MDNDESRLFPSVFQELPPCRSDPSPRNIHERWGLPQCVGQTSREETIAIGARPVERWVGEGGGEGIEDDMAGGVKGVQVWRGIAY